MHRTRGPCRRLFRGALRVAVSAGVGAAATTVMVRVMPTFSVRSEQEGAVGAVAAARVRVAVAAIPRRRCVRGDALLALRAPGGGYGVRRLILQ